jgi:hypothetical protein
LAARTSGYENPIVVEEVANFPIEGDYSVEEVRNFLGQLVDLKSGNYPAICGVYPKERFIRYHEVDSSVRLKNQSVLKKLLQSNLNIDPAINSISILDTYDGALFDPAKNATNQLVFCGAPMTTFQEVQDQILSYGLFPERLEMTSIATTGSLCNYAQLKQFDSSMMFIELASDNMQVLILNKGKVDMTRSFDFGLDSLFPILKNEMGLQDEASARKLFRSNTFDVAEMGRELLKKILKELQAISGYYEVQTGLNIDRFFTNLLPSKLSWIPDTISNLLGINPVKIEFEPWLQSLGIDVQDSVDLSMLSSQWLGIFSLMSEFKLKEEVEL